MGFTIETVSYKQIREHNHSHALVLVLMKEKNNEQKTIVTEVKNVAKSPIEYSK